MNINRPCGTFRPELLPSERTLQDSAAKDIISTSHRRYVSVAVDSGRLWALPPYPNLCLSDRHVGLQIITAIAAKFPLDMQLLWVWGCIPSESSRDILDLASGSVCLLLDWFPCSSG